MKRIASKKSVKSSIGYAVLALASAAAVASPLSGCRVTAREDDARQPDTSQPAAAATHTAYPREVDIPAAYAPGDDVEENDKAAIDYSNSSEGYVMVMFRQNSDNRLWTLIDGPGGEQYVYALIPGGYAAYTLTEGDGRYVITVCEQTDGMKYKVILRAHIDVLLTDPFAPFLRPNQHVDYNSDSTAVRIAAELAAEAEDLIDVINLVYSYTTDNITYDMEMVNSVESGYMPDLDAVLARGKGICFDYAAVMTAMLRSLGIPTKMVFGYLEDYYHAWISVYSEDEGWIDNIIFFDGHDWRLMDPTFTSNGRVSGEAWGYVGSEADYIAKFHY